MRRRRVHLGYGVWPLLGREQGTTLPGAGLHLDNLLYSIGPVLRETARRSYSSPRYCTISGTSPRAALGGILHRHAKFRITVATAPRSLIEVQGINSCMQTGDADRWGVVPSAGARIGRTGQAAGEFAVTYGGVSGLSTRQEGIGGSSSVTQCGDDGRGGCAGVWALARHAAAMEEASSWAALREDRAVDRVIEPRSGGVLGTQDRCYGYPRAGVTALEHARRCHRRLCKSPDAGRYQPGPVNERLVLRCEPRHRNPQAVREWDQNVDASGHPRSTRRTVVGWSFGVMGCITS